MSSQKVKVEIEICSNCKSHQWCTRHKQENYSALALDTKRLIESKDPSIDVQIFQVGGTAMGSFEIICKGVVLFSKLGLGYFPHVPSAVTRVIEFVDDFRNGRDLKKYSEARSVSPHKTMLSSTSNGFKQKSVSTSSPKIAVKRVKYDPNSQPQKEEEKDKKQMEAHKNPSKNNEQENHKQKIEEKPKNKQAEHSQKQIVTENKQVPKQAKKQSHKSIPNDSQKEIKNERDTNKDSNKHIPANQNSQVKPQQDEVKQKQQSEPNFILKQEQNQQFQSHPTPQSANEQTAVEVPKQQANAENPTTEQVSNQKQGEVAQSKVEAQNEDRKIE